MCCPQPKWYNTRFAEVFEAFSHAFKGMPSNMHVTELYQTDPTMFKLSGRHLKSAFGKDLLDHLIARCEEGMIRVSLDGDVRASEADNRLAVVEGRVDLVHRDLAHSSQRLDVVVARASEDGDAIANEK